MRRVKVAILGANGQIGSVLTKLMSSSDEINVVAICRNDIGAQMLKNINCEVRLGSVMSSSFDHAILSDCDVVLNCIWPSGSSQQVQKQNNQLLKNIEKQSLQQTFISLSSVAVYGSCIDKNYSTFLAPKPDNPYGDAKLKLENKIKKVFGGSEKPLYQIRLGHVFGAEQWLSNFIIGSLTQKSFSLPFDGFLPSNAVHVNDLAHSLTKLILNPPKSGIYNLAPNPQLSWKELFYWHSINCGLNNVIAMDQDLSQKYRERYVKESQSSPLSKGFQSLGGLRQTFNLSWLFSSSEFKYLGNILLSCLPARYMRRLKARWAMHVVRQQIEELNQLNPIPGPFLFCDGMPGDYLSIPSGGELTKNNELKEYYRVGILGLCWK